MSASHQCSSYELKANAVGQNTDMLLAADCYSPIQLSDCFDLQQTFDI